MNDDDSPPKTPPEEPTVRQLLEDPKAHAEALDPATLAELQRWFGMPSAMDLPPAEPTAEELSRRDQAIAAVEPEFLEYMLRHETRLPLMMEPAHLDVRAAEDLKTIPERFEVASKIGEPREIELSYLLYDDLKETVPQALLRDLHRPEQYFGKYYELTQVSEGIPDIRRDIAAAITRGEEERKLVQIREELSRAIEERENGYAFVWSQVGKADPPEPVEGEEASP